MVALTFNVRRLPIRVSTTHQHKITSAPLHTAVSAPRRAQQKRAGRGFAWRQATVQATNDAAPDAAPAPESVDPTAKRIGILGGGQLGRMMALAAATVTVARSAMQGNLGIPVSTLDPTDPAPASVAARQQVGSFTDAAAIEAFVLGEKIDVLTVEIEHVDVDAIEAVQDKCHIEVHPSPKTLRIIQDKFAQKEHFAAAGLNVAAYREIVNEDSMQEAGERFGYPFMLKSKRLAYDGRGNAVVDSPTAAAAAVASLGGFSQGLYAEKWAPFVKELAVMVARSPNGQTKCFPLVETVHEESILALTEAPAPVSVDVAKAALDLADAAVSSLDDCGIFGVEMFMMPNGDILINEVAPRPHNSGHYTMDACATSQFEQVLRAVLGWPLGSTELLPACAIMYNMIGQADGDEGVALARTTMARAYNTQGASLHWYDKAGCREKRKIGHVNIVGKSRAEAMRRLEDVCPGASDKLAAGGANTAQAEVAIIMGSDSDLPCMGLAADVLKDFGVTSSVSVVSAHRTPERMFEFAKHAHLHGIKIIIAGAGGAAHLPGMVAALTPLPVIGVPCTPHAAHLGGVDALLSICQMPRGVPVATVAIGNATNAGLLAVRMLGVHRPELLKLMSNFQESQRMLVERKAGVLEETGWEPYLNKQREGGK